MRVNLILSHLLLGAANTAFAATCYDNKPFSDKSLSGQDVATMLGPQVSSICGTGQPEVQNDDNTWNYGSVQFRIRKAAESTDVSACSDAFNNIIQQCIESQYWGGEWTLNGATFNIYNGDYPNNPFLIIAGDLDGFVGLASNAVSTYTSDPTNSDKAESAAAAVAAALAFASISGAPASEVSLLQDASSAASAAAASPGPDAASALSSSWDSVDSSDQNNHSTTTTATATTKPTTTPTTTTTTTSTSTSLTLPITITDCSKITQTNLPPGAITTTTSTSATPSVTPNPDGTNVHVQAGCIVINDSPRCAGGDAYNVASGNSPTNSATFYAKINAPSTDSTTVPGCKLVASWPANYGDVTYGDGDCLRDANGNIIDNQCCITSTTDVVTNPYYTGSTSTPEPVSTGAPPTCWTSQQQLGLALGDLSKVQSHAQAFCEALQKKKVKMGPGNVQLPDSVLAQAQAEGAASNGNWLIYSLVWSKDGCSDSNNPVGLDFTTYSQDACVAHYVADTAQKCPDYGGQVAADCALWSIDASN